MLGRTFQYLPQPLSFPAFPAFFKRSIARGFIDLERTWQLKRPNSERKRVAEEPAHLFAIIGRRIFNYEFMRHSKPTGNLTQVRKIRAKDYTGGMSAFRPFRS
jgi:hypothetical protein